MTRRPPAVAALAGALTLTMSVALAGAVEHRHDRPAWSACERAIAPGLECAAVRAPLDYDHPRGASVRLALIRHRAADPAHRVGTLFFNPGGPGGLGTAFLPGLIAFHLFPTPITDRFDIVSWDPRGVGESTAVQCFRSQRAENNRFLSKLPQGFPAGRTQKRRWVRIFERFGRRCDDRNGALLRHVSTADTARDLNRIRRTLGAGRLNYLGISYGTFLGATYANLFPDRVRAMVLDGNVNPRSWMHPRPRLNGGRFLGTELRLRTDRGTARTLEGFLKFCGRAGTGRCAFSAGNPADTRAKYAALLRRLRRHAKAGYGAIVGETANALDTVRQVGEDEGWANLAATLQEAWRASGTSKPLAERPEPGSARPSPFPETTPDRGGRAEQSYAGVEQQYAIYCSESPNPRPAAFWSLSRIGFERSGALGQYWSWLPEPCATWPAKAADRYGGPWDRATANPVLVIGNTHDPSTPYRESRAMVRQLGRARLLTVDGYGHSELLNPSSCARRYESRYLIGLALPPVGMRCEQNYEPFTQRP